MKSFIILNLIVFLQLFLIAHSKAVADESNELKTIPKTLVTLDKYKNVTDWRNDGNANKNLQPLVIDSEKLTKKISSNKIDNPSAIYYKSQLNDFELSIYNALEKICNQRVVKSLAATITNLDGFKAKEYEFDNLVGRAVGAFMRDNQEYWWIHSYERSGLLVNGYVSYVTVEIVSEYTISEINKYNPEVLNVAQSIAERASKEKTLYKKLLYIHDYLVKSITYTNDGKSSVYHNLYGALINKKCVCGAYGEAFAVISRLVGGYVIGVNSYTHGWDYAKIGKDWYAVDATLDDHDDGKEPSHNYFLVGTNTVVDDDGHRYKDEKEIRTIADYIEVENATGFIFPTLSKEKCIE
ncbi:hypothetical protein H8356DRAFT_1370601 [Neocallimastix lanati (nom. inval.)]|uniref:Transglutaminase-like domain-containing protein n=1 Tax=Neocallimastix californiae TaxID=1754190 RepID=A0A1Y2ADM9_9FUNG|nr:hypothetical protein H8356DRAFT_1370601 [Neocallimastix sp. JGI-2020a]ORY20668.1 hypothetical protein LY90DRAFT_516624 [Neocallimastix californiae]|eukprot:ORY20668.1 hypothetical protein LY90DRAFT_516624 [Neocallimastix californiae]